MKKSELRKLIREEISKFSTSKGDIVTIPNSLTTDPYNKKGESGTVEYISRDGKTIVVEFEDNKLGLYDSEIFNK